MDFIIAEYNKMPPRLRRNIQQFMNIAYGPKIKVKLSYPEENFFNIIPMNNPLVRNKVRSEQNRFRRTRYHLVFDQRNPKNIQNFYKISALLKSKSPVVRRPFLNYETQPFMSRAGSISNAAKKVQRAYRSHLNRRHQAARKIQSAHRSAFKTNFKPKSTNRLNRPTHLSPYARSILLKKFLAFNKK
jgi:hypothetical protein